jgi:hypothetical protein
MGALPFAPTATMLPKLEHDPEKWKPVFGQDHAQNEQSKRGTCVEHGHRVLQIRNADNSGHANDRDAGGKLARQPPVELDWRSDSDFKLGNGRSGRI